MYLDKRVHYSTPVFKRFEHVICLIDCDIYVTAETRHTFI